MRERRRAQAHPTVERARQSVLQTPRKRRQTHHDFADVFVPVAASASVVVAAGESNDTVRDPRERRDACLPGPRAFVPIERTEHPDGPRDVRSTPRREKRENPRRIPTHHHRRDPGRFAERLLDGVARRRDFIDGFVVEFEVVAAGVSITVASLGSSRESSRVPSAFLSLTPFLLARGGLPAGRHADAATTDSIGGRSPARRHRPLDSRRYSATRRDSDPLAPASAALTCATTPLAGTPSTVASGSAPSTGARAGARG